MKDAFHRTINYLRISVTDRCDLRCTYCMPESGVRSLPHQEILTYEEILRVAASFARLGISRIKVTGGEPLVRRNVIELIRSLKALPGIEEVTLTTNGTHLAGYIEPLAEAKIDGINLSLDTLNPELYAKITGRDAFYRVYEGLQKALLHREIKLKINCVPMGMPEQDFTEMAGLAKSNPVHVRFIEMMPIGLGRDFPFHSEEDIIRELEQTYGELVPFEGVLGNGPCHYYSAPGFQGKIGFISAMSHKFCSGCNRVRLTADGKLKTCLQYDAGLSLKNIIRAGAPDGELEAAILHELENKPREHHFAEELVAHRETRPMFQIGG